MKYLKRYKLLENLAQARAIVRNSRKHMKQEKFEQILDVTNSDEYTGIITKLIFDDNVNENDAFRLYNYLSEYWDGDVSILDGLSYREIVKIVYSEDDYDTTVERILDIITTDWDSDIEDEELLPLKIGSSFNGMRGGGVTITLKGDEIVDLVSRKVGMSKEDFLKFFKDNKTAILNNDRFTQYSALTDILLYHIYGPDAHPLAGYDMEDQNDSGCSGEETNKKYSYNIHKSYWGRKMIEQSYGTIAKWFQDIATDRFLAAFYGNDCYGLYGNKLEDLFNVPSNDMLENFEILFGGDNIKRVKNVRNGAVITLYLDVLFEELNDRLHFVDSTKEEFMEAMIEPFSKEKTEFHNGVLRVKILDTGL